MADKNDGMFRSLPQIVVLEQALQVKTRKLLTELEGVVDAKKSLEEREAEIKGELQGIQERVGLAGLRDGPRCFVAEQVAGRKTLDKGLLVENGCPVKVLEASYKQGEAMWRRTFKVLDGETGG